MEGGTENLIRISQKKIEKLFPMSFKLPKSLERPVGYPALRGLSDNFQTKALKFLKNNSYVPCPHFLPAHPDSFRLRHSK